MALINKDTVLKDCLRQLKKSAPMTGVELLSYKRNRTIAVTRIDGDNYLIKVEGYINDEFVTPDEKLAKTLKIMIKREFPRSRKVRVFHFENPEQLDRKKQRI